MALLLRADEWHRTPHYEQPRAANDGGEETKTARRSSNDDSAKNNASEQDFAV